MPPKETRWMTQLGFARYVGVNRRTVGAYIGRGVIELNANGKIDRDLARLALFEYLRKGAAGRAEEQAPKPGELDLTFEKARLAKESADEKSMKNAELRGELIPADAVETFIVSLLSGVQTRLRGVPTKAAPMVHGAASAEEVRGILEEIQDEALQELADALAGDRPTVPA